LALGAWLGSAGDARSSEARSRVVTLRSQDTAVYSAGAAYVDSVTARTTERTNRNEGRTGEVRLREVRRLAHPLGENS
jgi:hypothetical protein